jgi:tetratricopeptide (TPR) repeat protein
LETPAGAPPPPDTPGGALWLFLVGAQAVRDIRAHRLDSAEHTYLEIHRVLLRQPESPQQRSHLAAIYHQLGRVAQQRGHLDQAEDWYRQSLTIKEQLGDRPGMAGTYHQLGVVARRRGHLDEAEDWCRQSLTINEELGNRPDMASSYGQLGLLAEERGRPSEALTWMVRCVALFDEFPHPATVPVPEHLARLTTQLGIDTLEQRWQQVTGSPLPHAVRDYIQRKEPSQ